MILFGYRKDFTNGRIKMESLEIFVLLENYFTLVNKKKKVVDNFLQMC